MNNSNIKVIVFGNSLLLSNDFVVSTKIKHLTKQNLDIGEEIKKALVTHFITPPSESYTRLYGISITHEKLVDLISRFLQLLNSYYNNNTKEMNIYLFIFLTYSFTSIRYYIELERFTVLFMTIVDYLEIDDRLLIHTDDWMNTIKSIYKNIMQDTFPAKYKGKYNWSTSFKLKTFGDLTSKMELLERYIFPNIEEISLGKQLLKSNKKNENGKLIIILKKYHNINYCNIKYFYEMLFSLRTY